ncbi:MAG: hypothetical protein K9K80_01285 [Spirochaetia bacterium]|nr:hypothetical protein [Spirochaetia bacterium]
MRVGNLKVEGKIVLIIIPFIIGIILVLSLLDGYAMRRLYSTSMSTYLNHLIENYIHEYPRHLQ